MLNCAVIGAGFSGLALCYYLLDKGQKVTVFDGKGVGGEASGIASGLMHPYPGHEARLSWKGQEAMESSKELFKIVAQSSNTLNMLRKGVIRLALTERQKAIFFERSLAYDDVEWIEDVYSQLGMHQQNPFSGILIHSGVTVHPTLYLKALWEVCRKKGAKFFQKNVVLKDLESFDQVAIAAGKGVSSFKGSTEVGLKLNKGQILKCEKPSSLKSTHSLIGNGYIAISHLENRCYLGSTYERGFLDDAPCLKRAKELILPRLEQYFSFSKEIKILSCVSAVRVSHFKNYHPIADQIDAKTWVLSGMGSRGLLYHSYLGKKLACAMVERNTKQLPKEVRIVR